MSTISHPHLTPVHVRSDTLADPTAQAFWLLRIVFVVAPIVAGIDKYFDKLVEWQIYLAPDINKLIPGSAQDAMHIFGAVEIVAGAVVALWPRYGGYLVALWLAGIIVNLLIQQEYYDIALRDFGLLIAAVALARLGAEMHNRQTAHLNR